MIKLIYNEYREGDLAVKCTKVTFLGIPIFNSKKTSTNNKAVAMLAKASQSKKVIGFSYETKD